MEERPLLRQSFKELANLKPWTHRFPPWTTSADDMLFDFAPGASASFLTATLTQAGSHTLLIRTSSPGTNFVLTLDPVGPVPSPNGKLVCQGCQTPTETLTPHGDESPPSLPEASTL